jgi:hypothetical protein
MSIETLHKKTGKILDAKNRVESLEYRLGSLDSAKRVLARTDIEIDGNKRGSYTEWLSVEELRNILSSRLESAKSELAKLESEFNRQA